MNEQEFRHLVVAMRAAQKAYVANRTIDNLKTAKTLENQVDRALDVQDTPAQQEPLLGEGMTS